MFRAALLTIVLTLAAGQNAALVCGVWCHPSAGMAGACEHQTLATPGIATNDGCALNASPVVFVREDGRRSVATPDVEGAVAAATFALTAPPAGIVSAYEPDSPPLRDLRPLALALRI